MYEWDEAKREINLREHRLDFADAHLVYENPRKVTIRVQRKGENRLQDVAMVELLGSAMALVYVLRQGTVRCISFRKASRKERLLYAKRRQEAG